MFIRSDDQSDDIALWVTSRPDDTGDGTLITADMLCGISEFDADLARFEALRQLSL